MRKSIVFIAVLIAGITGSQWAQAETCNGVTGNLVQNCAFGTGDFTDWSGTAISDPFNYVDSYDPLAIGATPYDGLTYEAALGSSSDETLSRTFATVAGDQYTIEFALLNDTTPSSPYGNDFTATFGSTTLFTETGMSADSYVLYTYTAEATGPSTTLAFTSSNSEGDFELDSISAQDDNSSVIPEPSSLLLLGSGLMALAGVARWRFSR